jgi:hypothetical protein
MFTESMSIVGIATVLRAVQLRDWHSIPDRVLGALLAPCSVYTVDKSIRA